MILSILNYENTGKSTTLCEVIKQLLNNADYKYIKGKTTEDNTEYTTAEKLKNDLYDTEKHWYDYCVIFQQKSTRKYFIIITVGDEWDELLAKAWKWVFTIGFPLSLHSSSMFNILCATTLFPRKKPCVDEIKKQIRKYKLKNHDFQWIQQPSIKNEKGESVGQNLLQNQKLYIDLTLQPYVKSLIKFIEQS